MEISMLLPFFAIALLLVASGLISGSEISFFALGPTEIDELKQSKAKRDALIQELLETPDQLLSSILIANNFINVGIVMMSTIAFNNITAFKGMEAITLFLIQVVGVTFLILLVGEVIPKIYANKKPLILARIMVRPLAVMNKVFDFILLSKVLLYLGSLTGKFVKKRDTRHGVEDLETALKIALDEQNMDHEEGRILEGIVRFGNTEVSQVMRPRVDVVAFDRDKSYDEVLNEIQEHGYSRIPVYEDNLDKVVGVLYIKDLLAHIKEPTIDWVALSRKPIYVPENKKIDDLLKEMQSSKVHMAVVVDEYGGTQGIVTLEDILEEIVGDISDEFDDDEIQYTQLDEYNYIFEGKTSIVDFYKVIGLATDTFDALKGEADTLAGLVLECSGKIPLKGEKINILNYLFTIESSDKRRIRQIKVTLKNE